MMDLGKLEENIRYLERMLGEDTGEPFLMTKYDRMLYTKAKLEAFKEVARYGNNTSEHKNEGRFCLMKTSRIGRDYVEFECVYCGRLEKRPNIIEREDLEECNLE